MTYDEFWDEYDADAAAAAEGDAESQYGGGWTGAVGSVQVMIR